MKKTSLGLALAGLLMASSSVFALECAPDMYQMLNTTTYKPLDVKLTPADVTAFTNAMKVVSNDTQYQVVLNLADAMAAKVGATGRVVVTLPDGTVVVDTKKSATGGNTFANFAAKAINENHNSRLAILDAQMFPCGFGLETKFSSSTGTKEVSLAKRLGAYLNSYGTVRISQ